MRAIEKGRGKRTDDTQVGEDGIDLAPFHAWESGETIEHLARSLVEKLAEEVVQDQAGDVEQCLRSDSHAVEHEVVDVEVGCFGQVGGEQRWSLTRVLGDLLS